MLLFSNGPFVPLCRPITVETPPPPSMFQSPTIYYFEEGSTNFAIVQLVFVHFGLTILSRLLRLCYAVDGFNIPLPTKNSYKIIYKRCNEGRKNAKLKFLKKNERK